MQNLDQTMPKMSIFWKKTEKSPQRRGIRPRTPIDPRFVYNTKDFNIPYFFALTCSLDVSI